MSADSARRSAASRHRKEVARLLGFRCFRDYLKSNLWRDVRRTVLERCNRTCQACGSAKATNVHFIEVSVPVLEGRDLARLVGCCPGCEEAAWQDGDRKVDGQEATTRLMVMVKETMVRNGLEVAGPNPCTLYGLDFRPAHARLVTKVPTFRVAKRYRDLPRLGTRRTDQAEVERQMATKPEHKPVPPPPAYLRPFLRKTKPTK